MGGRGASAGTRKSDTYEWRGKTHTYGDEYESVYQFGSVKFIKQKDQEDSLRTPMETRTPDRTYILLDGNNNIKSIVLNGSDGKREAQIDVRGVAHNGQLPHKHIGYQHDENGFEGNTKQVQEMVDKYEKIWAKARKRFKL